MFDDETYDYDDVDAEDARNADRFRSIVTDLPERPGTRR